MRKIIIGLGKTLSDKDIIFPGSWKEQVQALLKATKGHSVNFIPPWKHLLQIGFWNPKSHSYKKWLNYRTSFVLRCTGCVFAQFDQFYDMKSSSWYFVWRSQRP
jgi:hypothetical protein